jgi:hypothetical protein
MPIDFGKFQSRRAVLAERVGTGDSLEPPPFVCSPVWESGRLMFRTACTRCGADRVVSLADGSLQQWVTEHACDPMPQVEVEVKTIGSAAAVRSQGATISRFLPLPYYGAPIPFHPDLAWRAGRVRMDSRSPPCGSVA